MAHFFAVDPSNSFAVVFGGRGIEQIFLLLDRREFGIA
jgi:hypothetical protein